MLQKHSVTLQGHQTSVSLEPEFWRLFKNIAERDNIGVNALASQIDQARDMDTNLASAIRLYVLSDLEARLDVEVNAVKRSDR